MDNETWVIEEGDRVIRKRAGLGVDRLMTWERLVFALWVADYGMRNAGDLDTARDVYPDFQSAALRAARTLSLPVTCDAFALAPKVLKERCFDLFEKVCDEIRRAEPGTNAAGGRDPGL